MNHFPLTLSDIIVIAGYLLLVLYIGFYFRRRMSSAEDYFAGGHQVPWWLAGVSHYISSASALTFIAYAVLWVGFWMTLRGTVGEVTGLLGGTVAMGAILAFAFDAPRAAPKIILALFILNALGYYAGGKIEGKLAVEHRLLAMLLWGACYGIGFGAGLGAAFHLCQQRARAILRQP